MAKRLEAEIAYIIFFVMAYFHSYVCLRLNIHANFSATFRLDLPIFHSDVI